MRGGCGGGERDVLATCLAEQTQHLARRCAGNLGYHTEGLLESILADVKSLDGRAALKILPNLTGAGSQRCGFVAW